MPPLRANLDFRSSDDLLSPNSCLMPREIGGWDDDRLLDRDSVDPDLLCAICSCVCRDAVRCQYEHAFCSHCIHRWLALKKTCPIGHPLKPDGLIDARLVRKFVDKIIVKCRFHRNGCAESYPIETIVTHESGCTFPDSSLPCRHLLDGCTARSSPGHNSICTFQWVPCERCGSDVRRGDMATHLLELGCITHLRLALEGSQSTVTALKAKVTSTVPMTLNSHQDGTICSPRAKSSAGVRRPANMISLHAACSSL